MISGIFNVILRWNLHTNLSTKQILYINKFDCYTKLISYLEKDYILQNISNKTDIGWGHQIRSYVLQPYRLVKDLRTEEESTNPEDVLNGNLDQFIEGNLFKK